MLLLLLVWFLILVCVNNNPDSFNGPESTEFALEILFRCVVAKSCNNQGLEGISTNVWIFLRLIKRWCFLQQLLLTLLFFLLDTKFSLQPALSGFIMVVVLVFLELREKRRNARDGRSLSIFRRVVRGRQESKPRTRREQREEIWGELIRHLHYDGR